MTDRCPICGGEATRDRPDLGAVDATCTACGWHFTTAAAKARLAAEEAELDALEEGCR